MTFSDQDSLSIVTATCPYTWARARARSLSLSIHPKIVEMKVQNPETHPLPHAKNGKSTGKGFWLGRDRTCGGLEFESFSSSILPGTGVSSLLPRKK